MIKPTIGRVVLVNIPGFLQQWPALIAFVHSDRLINVGGFDNSGNPLALTSVPLLQDDDLKPEGIHAEWMPYQKGQAAKTEQAEAAARENPTHV
jgi:hypothetical protein